MVHEVPIRNPTASLVCQECRISQGKNMSEKQIPTIKLNKCDTFIKEIIGIKNAFLCNDQKTVSKDVLLILQEKCIIIFREIFSEGAT
jgi:hypothetical protein